MADIQNMYYPVAVTSEWKWGAWWSAGSADYTEGGDLPRFLKVNRKID